MKDVVNHADVMCKCNIMKEPVGAEFAMCEQAVDEKITNDAGKLSAHGRGGGQEWGGWQANLSKLRCCIMFILHGLLSVRLH